MSRLSSSTNEPQEYYRVVVVGSGYGGAIAASRMARAGQSVCVLEQTRSLFDWQKEYWDMLALALDPHDYRANYYYAWSLLKSGRIDQESLAKAEASLRAVMNGNPEFVPAYDSMAYVLSLEGGKERLDEAYTMTLQAVGREPGNVHYRVRAVEVLER